MYGLSLLLHTSSFLGNSIWKGQRPGNFCQDPLNCVERFLLGLLDTSAWPSFCGHRRGWAGQRWQLGAMGEAGIGDMWIRRDLGAQLVHDLRESVRSARQLDAEQLSLTFQLGLMVSILPRSTEGILALRQQFSKINFSWDLYSDLSSSSMSCLSARSLTGQSIRYLGTGDIFLLRLLFFFSVPSKSHSASLLLDSGFFQF